MDPALEKLGWTEEQWNRICTTVTEEAQKVRVAAQALPVAGPEDSSTIAIPRLTLTPQEPDLDWPTDERLTVNSNPDLNLTTISVYVPLRSHEVADPELKAALTMFRRAANYTARLEDAMVFRGHTGHRDTRIPGGVPGIPPVYTLATDGRAERGILDGGTGLIEFPADPTGEDLIEAIIAGITLLEDKGQLGPFACVLGHELFELSCSTNDSFVMPRDRILPFLQGPLLRTSTTGSKWGALIALSGNPVELVVASDIRVQYLQTTIEPRHVFRVTERIALQIKERNAIVVFKSP